MLELSRVLSTHWASTAVPTTAPTGAGPVPTWLQLSAILGCVGTVAFGATLAAYFLGAWRRGIQGPPRIAPSARIWPIIVALVGAFLGIFIGGAIAALFVRIVDGQELLEQIVSPPSAIEGESGVASQIIVRRMQISALSYAFAMGLALATLWAARLADWRGGIGARLENAPRGLLYGALAALLVIPWMMTASVLFQAVLKAIGVQVDAMHELIRAIRDHPEIELIGWGLFSATVVAPLAEEVLFRGVLQTTLVSMWARLVDRPSLDEGHGLIPADAVQQSPDSAVATEDLAMQRHALAYAASPPPPQVMRYPPSALARWVGILLTSAVFAVMHEPWSIPLIFILSMALGYLYERTGNLWTTIAVHFAFNSFNMLLILPLLLQ